MQEGSRGREGTVFFLFVFLFTQFFCPDLRINFYHLTPRLCLLTGIRSVKSFKIPLILNNISLFSLVLELVIFIYLFIFAYFCFISLILTIPRNNCFSWLLYWIVCAHMRHPVTLILKDA